MQDDTFIHFFIVHSNHHLKLINGIFTQTIILNVNGKLHIAHAVLKGGRVEGRNLARTLMLSLCVPTDKTTKTASTVKCVTDTYINEETRKHLFTYSHFTI